MATNPDSVVRNTLTLQGIAINDGIISSDNTFLEIKTSGHSGSNAIVLTSNSGVNETIEIHNTMGTSDGSGAGSGVGKYAINVVAHKGGINMEANSNIVLIPGATGNVGINTIHPDYTLDVAGDINLTGNIFVNGSQGVSNSLIPSLRAYINNGANPAPYNVSYAIGDFISFNVEHYDSFNAYDTSTYSYTIPSSGKYYIGVNLYINYSPSAYSEIAVLKNPATANTVIMSTNTYGEAGQTMSGVFDLTTDDIIKVKNIGRNGIYLGSGSGYTELSIHQVNYGHTFTNYYQTTFENISLDIIADSNYFKVGNTAVDIAGKDLLVQAGNTTVSAASGNIDGGDLLLKSGHASGTGSSSIRFWTNSGNDGVAPVEVVDIDNTGNVNIKNGSGGVSGSGNSITFKDSLSNIGSVTSGVMDIRSNFINLEASSNVVIKSNGTQSLHFGYQDLRNDGVSGGEWKIVNTDANSNIHLVTTDSNGAQNNIMTLDSYGRVGIGTDTNLVYGLEVTNAIQTNNDFRIDNTGASTAVRLYPIASELLLQVGEAFSSGSSKDFAITNMYQDSSTSSRKIMFKANGNVGIGTTNPSYKLSLGSDAADKKLAVYDGGSGVSVFYGFGAFNGQLKFWADNSTVGAYLTSGNNFYVNGSVYSNGSPLSSDDRIKENEQFISNATVTVMKLSPQIYDKKPSMDNSNVDTWVKESGLIAQEVYYDAPELRHLVTPGSNASNIDIQISSSDDPSIDPDYSNWGDTTAYLNYIGFIPYLIKMNQEQQELIESQQTTINSQQTIINDLQSNSSVQQTTINSQQTTINDLLARVTALETA